MTSLHDSQRQRRRAGLTSAFFVSDYETRAEFAFLLLQLPLTRAAHSVFPPQHTLPAWSDCVCCRCRCFHVHYEALVVFRLVFSSSSLSCAALSTWLCLECSQFVETQQCKHPPVPLPHPDPPASQANVHLAPWASWLKDFSARWWNYDKWRA